MTPRYGNVTDTDDEHRIVRDGERIVVGLALMDSTQQGEPKMNENTVVIDGTTMTKDAALEHLQGKVAALEAQVPVADAAIAARDAARLRARDSLLAQQAAKHNTESAHGEYVSKLRDSWKTGHAWR